jgi:tRNA(Ile)-lysidine synthase
VEAAAARLQAGRGPGWLAFERAGLLGLEDGLLRAVLRRAAQELRPGSEEIDLGDIVRAEAFTRAPSASRECSLSAGLWIYAEAGRIILAEPGAASLPDWLPQLEQAGVVDLPTPGSARLADGWLIQAELAVTSMAGVPESENEAWLDADALAAAGGLTVRPARPGECIQPLGMGGKSQKISDLWVNARIPRRARAHYPLVCAGDAVVWAPGVRRAEHLRVTAGTRRVVILKLIKNPA